MKATIGHITLNVSDEDKSFDFYDLLLTHLGFSINKDLSFENLKMRSYMQGEHNIWIRYSRDEEKKTFVRNTGLDHMAFRVNSEEEVDIIHQEIQKLKTKITRTPTHYPEYSGNYYAFYFRDYTGIPLEVYCQ